MAKDKVGKFKKIWKVKRKPLAFRFVDVKVKTKIGEKAREVKIELIKIFANWVLHEKFEK